MLSAVVDRSRTILHDGVREVLVAIVALALLLVACGSSTQSPTSLGGATLSDAAGGQVEDGCPETGTPHQATVVVAAGMTADLHGILSAAAGQVGKVALVAPGEDGVLTARVVLDTDLQPAAESNELYEAAFLDGMASCFAAVVDTATAELPAVAPAPLLSMTHTALVHGLRSVPGEVRVVVLDTGRVDDAGLDLEVADLSDPRKRQELAAAVVTSLIAPPTGDAASRLEIDFRGLDAGLDAGDGLVVAQRRALFHDICVALRPVRCLVDGTEVAVGEGPGLPLAVAAVWPLARRGRSLTARRSHRRPAAPREGEEAWTFAGAEFDVLDGPRDVARELRADGRALGRALGIGQVIRIVTGRRAEAATALEGAAATRSGAPHQAHPALKVAWPYKVFGLGADLGAGVLVATALNLRGYERLLVAGGLAAGLFVAGQGIGRLVKLRHLGTVSATDGKPGERSDAESSLTRPQAIMLAAFVLWLLGLFAGAAVARVQFGLVSRSPLGPTADALSASLGIAGVIVGAYISYVMTDPTAERLKRLRRSLACWDLVLAGLWRAAGRQLGRSRQARALLGVNLESTRLYGRALAGTDDDLALLEWRLPLGEPTLDEDGSLDVPRAAGERPSPEQKVTPLPPPQDDPEESRDDLAG
jgi:hypothetical protein